MKKVVKLVLNVFKFIAIIVIALLIFTTVTNAVITQIEKQTIHAPGIITKSNGLNIHLLIRGTGETKIVLLSGFGTPSPIFEFLPLIEKLEKNYTVCVVELNGYGWSKTTKTPRTNENIVNEIRMALHEANISPPYVLVPHSLSGIYSLYYANKYPEEIKAVIGLDIAIPVKASDKNILDYINLYGINRFLGLTRLAFLINPNYLGYDRNIYNDDTIKKINMFTCWNDFNINIWNEFNYHAVNKEELLGYSIPKNIPCRLILASHGLQYSSGIDLKTEYEKLISGNINGEVIILNGGHYIHRNNSREIAKIIDQMQL